MGAGHMTTAASGGGRRGPLITARRSGSDSPGVLTRLRRDALQAFAAGPFYRHTLLGRVPADLRLRIAQRWPGDAKRGVAIATGEVELAGELVRSPAPRWSPPSVGPEWLAAWHGFGWIADVAAAGTVGRAATRELVQSWIAENTGWNGIAWRSDVLGTRVFAWIAHFDEIVRREQEDPLRRAMLTSLVAQLRHLARTAAYCGRSRGSSPAWQFWAALRHAWRGCSRA